MSETHIMIRLLRMYIPRNWEFGSVMAKGGIFFFGGWGGLNHESPSVRYCPHVHSELLYIAMNCLLCSVQQGDRFVGTGAQIWGCQTANSPAEPSDLEDWCSLVCVWGNFVCVWGYLVCVWCNFVCVWGNFVCVWGYFCVSGVI
jgi:hypothetical protein